MISDKMISNLVTKLSKQSNQSKPITNVIIEDDNIVEMDSFDNDLQDYREAISENTKSWFDLNITNVKEEM